MNRFTPGPETSRTYRDALGKFATGITVVTCRTPEGAPVGMTVNSFASVSLDPPLVLWSPARASQRCAAFEEAAHFAVHILRDDQLELCQHFAGDGLNFTKFPWHPGEGEVPVLDGCLAHFECQRRAGHDGGDHAIIVGLVRAASAGKGSPLLFANGSYGRFTDLD